MTGTEFAFGGWLRRLHLFSRKKERNRNTSINLVESCWAEQTLLWHVYIDILELRRARQHVYIMGVVKICIFFSSV